MKVKKVLAVMMAGTMAMGIAVCSDAGLGTVKAADDASDKTLTIWAWDEAFNIVAANEAKEIYQKENPDAEVNVVTMAQDDIVAKLNTSLSSQSYDGLPDIVLIEDYKAQGYLTAYTDEFAELDDVAKPDDFAAYKTGVNQADGKMYGIPFDSGVAATFYRTDYIEEAGYTQEDMQDLTWEKYIEIGKAVKEKCGVDMCTLDPSDIGQIRMMMQSAGSWYTDAEGKVSIEDNQALKDAVTEYKNLVDAGITKQVADWDQFVGAFNNGEVASVVTGCWIAPSIQKAEDQSGKWAVAPFPKMEINDASINASSIGGAGWYVLKNVGHEELAKDFLAKTFAGNVDLMNQLVKDITLVSTLNTASEAPNYSEGSEFFGGQKIFDDFSNWTKEVPSVNYGMHTYAIEDIMTEAVQAIVGGADMDSVLGDYQIQAEAAVAQ
ncbi:ABC transporter substrate-binding protein [Murimonas intestini]|uniref:Lactose-binding protein n=1 Tax=Murimonas intestini TaxID=1337051 RepID=A0AB73SZ69_9FIRM|nr:extracellular solute-binding protein [Murimonas intestini]MCR1842894.1 extracellular solute-binding protein [Murimonas intestini]MCR1868142.1 extracellular solute-binding protein [Murimonas intestini]MCR1885366.1 extracellular solute-binding protein [Murimonas intestini]